MCWERRPLSAPEEMQEVLSRFDTYAKARLEDLPSELPTRLELAETMSDRVLEVLPEWKWEHVQAWLMESCTSHPQANNIAWTLEQASESPWPLESPVLAFLWDRWGEELPEELQGWARMWRNLFLPGAWPAPSPELVEKLTAEAAAESGAPDPATARLAPADTLDWWSLTSRMSAWSQSSDEFGAALFDYVFEEWARGETELLPEFAAFPATRKLALLQAALQANEVLRETLSEAALRDYLMDQPETVWPLEFGHKLEKQGEAEAAYAFLKAVAQRQPGNIRLHQALAQMADRLGNLEAASAHQAAADAALSTRQSVDAFHENLSSEFSRVFG